MKPQQHVAPAGTASVASLRQGDLAATDVDQAIAVTASKAEEEEAALIDLGRDSTEHHLEPAGSAFPHDASPVMRAQGGMTALREDDKKQLVANSVACMRCSGSSREGGAA